MPLPAVVPNPVVPGFHPDPSIVRVGDDFYLVTSTFEYFPGVPVLHSRNLVDWELIGHCLSRPSQLPLAQVPSSQGIYAPTIRHHEGTFYMVTTNMSHGGNFYVTATNPRAEWSEPTWIGECGIGMDPSLFFDRDGKVYFTGHGGGERGAILQAEIDLRSGRLLHAPREIWRGTGGIWPEGPHLYRKGEFYYLLISEGGTSYGHSVTVARSSSPWGPFEGCPRNPILTHRDRRDLPIQATGHADLVELPDGSWAMVFLGIRPPDGNHHHLGRETFAARVDWIDGWPLVNGGRPIGLGNPRDVSGMRDDFDEPRLPLPYLYVRNPRPELYSLSARPGWLRLLGTEATLEDVASPTFVGRRQQHLRARVSTLVSFEPGPGHSAGLVLRANESNHYGLLVKQTGAARTVRLETRVQGETCVASEVALPTGDVELRVEAYPDRYEFFAAVGERAFLLGQAGARALSSELAGGFTGVVVGLAATGDGSVADFDYLAYEGLE